MHCPRQSHRNTPSSKQSLFLLRSLWCSVSAVAGTALPSAHELQRSRILCGLCAKPALKHIQWHSLCNRPPPHPQRLQPYHGQKGGVQLRFLKIALSRINGHVSGDGRNQWQHLFIAAHSHLPHPEVLREPLPWQPSISTNVWMWKWNSWRQWGFLCFSSLTKQPELTDLSLWTCRELPWYELLWNQGI